MTRLLYWPVFVVAGLLTAAVVLGLPAAHAAAGPDLICTTTTKVQTLGTWQDYCYKSNGSEVLTGSSPTDWSVTADDSTAYPYPDVRTTGIPADSSFKIAMPSGNYGAEAAYDICQNGCSASGDAEMMIWVNNHGETPWKPVKDMTRITSLDDWTLYRDPGTVLYVWMPKVNETSYSNVPVAQMVKDTGLKDLNTCEFGWEIHDTDGSAKKFTLDAFSVS
jgi:hypothetical protein